MSRGLGRVFDMKDPVANRRDDSTDAAFRDIQKQIGQGAQARKLGPIPLSTTATDVAHMLGRGLVGWRVADIDAHATVKRESSPDEAKWLRLVSSAAANVSVEVW